MISALLVWSCVAAAARAGGGHGFYRAMRSAQARVGLDGGAGEARRVFGGRPAPLSAFGAACALLDARRTPRCSCAVLAPRWALTAAHCVAPHLAYVLYNTRRPASGQGDLAAVSALYRHPGYRVRLADADVTLLRHDVGLVRSQRNMLLAAPPPRAPLAAMRLHAPRDLLHQEVQVLGFGRTEAAPPGEELFEVRLRLAACGREAWRHCVCGRAEGARGARGVCAGDSGGPVVWGGAQVGVTSLGPLECAVGDAPDAFSVFTALYHYADLINATISDAEPALRMRRVRARAAPPGPPGLLTALGALASLAGRGPLH